MTGGIIPLGWDGPGWLCCVAGRTCSSLSLKSVHIKKLRRQKRYSSKLKTPNTYLPRSLGRLIGDATQGLVPKHPKVEIASTR